LDRTVIGHGPVHGPATVRSGPVHGHGPVRDGSDCPVHFNTLITEHVNLWYISIILIYARKDGNNWMYNKKGTPLRKITLFLSNKPSSLCDSTGTTVHTYIHIQWGSQLYGAVSSVNICPRLRLYILAAHFMVLDSW
jgi:hypothetical protein